MSPPHRMMPKLHPGAGMSRKALKRVTPGLAESHQPLAPCLPVTYDVGPSRQSRGGETANDAEAITKATAGQGKSGSSREPQRTFAPRIEADAVSASNSRLCSAPYSIAPLPWQTSHRSVPSPAQRRH